MADMVDMDMDANAVKLIQNQKLKLMLTTDMVDTVDMVDMEDTDMAANADLLKPLLKPPQLHIMDMVDMEDTVDMEDMDMGASEDQLNHTMVMVVMEDTDMDMDVKNLPGTTQYAKTLVPSLNTYPSKTFSLNPLIISSKNLKKETFDLSCKRDL